MNTNGARLIEYAQVEARALGFLSRRLGELEAKLASGCSGDHEAMRAELVHASQLAEIARAASEARLNELTSP